MAKRAKRWSLWRIATATLVCGLVAPALFRLAAYLEKSIEQRPADLGQRPVLSLSSFIMILGTAAGILAVLGLIWLVVRIRDARTPAWKKKRRF